MKKPETVNGVATLAAPGRPAWRAWLEKNHQRGKNVWLILFKKNSNIPSISYEEAVEEALCYGWIDSKALRRDEHSYYQYFARRKPDSIWSESNRKRVEKLIASGMMKEAGLATIREARERGRWEPGVQPEQIPLPKDLALAFQKNQEASKHFNAFSPDSKISILQWLQSARNTEIREARITETVNLAAGNLKPKM